MIECPAEAHIADVEQVSGACAYENEILIGRGARYQLFSVRWIDNPSEIGKLVTKHISYVDSWATPRFLRLGCNTRFLGIVKFQKDKITLAGYPGFLENGVQSLLLGHQVVALLKSR